MNSGLGWRIPLGVALVAALLGIAWLDVAGPYPGVPLFVLALVAAWLGADELRGLWGKERPSTPGLSACLVTVLVVASSGIPFLWSGYRPASFPVGPLGWPLLALTCGLGILLVLEIFRYRQPGEVGIRLALGTLAMAYVGLLLSFAVQLRLSQPAQNGVVAVLSMIAVIKLCDIGAYTFGRLFGRHKMAPWVSPGKTWEGAAGGVGLGVAGAYLLFEQVFPQLKLLFTGQQYPAWGWLVYGIVLSLVGMLGDLAESLLKRDAGKKDSSTWLQGFGGVLDILDSLLLGSPAAYVLWTAGIVGI